MKGFGTAIVFVLILVMTLLGTSALHDSLLGTTLATSRVLNQQAFALAELGGAAAIAEIANGIIPASAPLTRFIGSVPGDRATTAVRLIDTTALPPGFSAGRFTAERFEVTSTGETSRHARVTIAQGITRIGPASGGGAP